SATCEFCRSDRKRINAGRGLWRTTDPSTRSSRTGFGAPSTQWSRSPPVTTVGANNRGIARLARNASTMETRLFVPGQSWLGDIENLQRRGDHQGRKGQILQGGRRAMILKQPE